MVKSRQLVIEYRAQIGKYTYAQMDCIRSITNILARYGGKADIDGSNWYARREIVNLRPLTSRNQLYDGCAVLKSKHPGEPGYDLPDTYKNDANQIDYNHIGIGTSDGEILDSTTIRSGSDYLRNGPGVSTAPINSNSWDIIGDFEDVDYSDKNAEQGENKVATKATVKADKGSTVNLRSRPAIDSVVIEYVKIGEQVIVLEKTGEWIQAKTVAGNVGWMNEKFLQGGAQDADPPVVNGFTPEQADLLRQAKALIERVLGNG